MPACMHLHTSHAGLHARKHACMHTHAVMHTGRSSPTPAEAARQQRPAAVQASVRGAGCQGASGCGGSGHPAQAGELGGCRYACLCFQHSDSWRAAGRQLGWLSRQTQSGQAGLGCDLTQPLRCGLPAHYPLPPRPAPGPAPSAPAAACALLLPCQPNVTLPRPRFPCSAGAPGAEGRAGAAGGGRLQCPLLPHRLPRGGARLPPPRPLA